MRFVVLPLLVTMATPAVASPGSVGDEATTPQPRIQYAERTHIDFESVDVTTELQRPSITWVPGTKSPSFPSLIRLREDFKDQLRASVDRVK